MKILIVDDNRSKWSKLIPALAKIGIARSEIEVAECASDARRRLQNDRFDLLILDLQLPEELEGDPNLQPVKDLLDDLSDDDIYIRPNMIIGFSAYQKYIEEIQSIQSAGSMVFYRFDESSEEWLEGILNAARFCLQQQKNTTPFDFDSVDLCIITALYDPELKAVLNLPWNWKEPEPIDSATMIRRGSFSSNGAVYSVIAASASRMGMVASTAIATKLIAYCKPRFVVMSGICAGVRGKTNYGDILLANPSWDYQCGKRLSNSDGSVFYIAPHQLHVKESIEVRLLELGRDSVLLRGIKDSWQGDKPDSELKVLSGPVGCGSAVLADQSIIDELIRSQQRNLLGIEMEAYGIYSAANSSSDPSPFFFCVKSVCDFSDNQKDDKYQKYAAYTSAAIVKAFFEKYASFFKRSSNL